VGRLKSRVRWPVVGAGLDRKEVVIGEGFLEDERMGG